ncbi:MAG: hypothetical protein ACR65O_10450 [Methylomicrobium sp.]
MKKWLLFAAISILWGCSSGPSRYSSYALCNHDGTCAVTDLATGKNVTMTKNEFYSANNSPEISTVATALLSGAAQAALTPGNSTSKVGAGLMGASKSMLDSTANFQSDNSGIGNYVSSTSSGSQTTAYSSGNSSNGSSYSGNSTCSVNFNHLSASMPAFSDPMLHTTREFILNYTMVTVVSDAKNRGWSRKQAVEMAMRQADKFEEAAQQNARAASGVSTYLRPKGIVMGVNSGQISLSLPCSGSTSMVEAAECEVIRDVWQAMLFREIARQLPFCW